MGFLKKSPEEAARKEAERQAEKDKRRAEKEAEERRVQELIFRDSPAGQALTARENGAGIFQIALPLSKTTANVIPMIGAFTRGQAVEVHSTILDSIEQQGWHLDHVGYIFRVTGSESRDKFLASGQQEAVSGEIIGIYLFRAVEPKLPPITGKQEEV